MSDDTVKRAARKVHDLLEPHFWPNGDWLSGVVARANRVAVMTSRELRRDEAKLIPAEMDGVPVEVTVVGEIEML